MRSSLAITALVLALLLGGCAGQAALQEARAFAAGADKLDAFAELTEHFRDTYQREQPYLSAAADAAERELDARRRAASADFAGIERSVQLYMHTLGQLAGGATYDLSGQVSKLGSGIKAWPESGLDQTHAAAYTALGQLLTRMAASSQQEAALRAMVSEGDAPLQSLLEAMGALLRYFDKTNSNEKKLVLGLFDVELAFAEPAQARLLTALARAHRQSKAAEYAQVARRYAPAGRSLEQLARQHRSLLERLGVRATIPLANDLQGATQ